MAEVKVHTGFIRPQRVMWWAAWLAIFLALRLYCRWTQYAAFEIVLMVGFVMGYFLRALHEGDDAR